MRENTWLRFDFPTPGEDDGTGHAPICVIALRSDGEEFSISSIIPIVLRQDEAVLLRTRQALKKVLEMKINDSPMVVA
jgi:hypothetical protein